MNKEQVMKFLIPLVAIVVVLESVVIITGASKKESALPSATSVNESTATSSPKKVKKDAVGELLFEVDSKTMKVGQSYKVTLGMYPKKNFDIDAADLYVKFDPEMMSVSGLSGGDTTLGKPTSLKLSKDKGMIVANYWISDPKGYGFQSGKMISLMSFEVTPKKEGVSNIEIATRDADGNSDTMLVEKGSNVLSFDANPLTVNVTK